MQSLLGGTEFHRGGFFDGYLVVIPHKKEECKENEFDVLYNFCVDRLYFLHRSGSIIATFVRHGKTQEAESGDYA